MCFWIRTSGRGEGQKERKRKEKDREWEEINFNVFMLDLRSGLDSFTRGCRCVNTNQFTPPIYLPDVT